MADGDTSVNGSGDSYVDSNGDEYVKCCCGATGCLCGSGGTAGPLTAAITIASTTLCTGCRAWGPGGLFGVNLTGSANGSWTATYVGSGCEWRANLTGGSMAITGNVYNNSGCSGSPSAINSNTIVLRTPPGFGAVICFITVTDASNILNTGTLQQVAIFNVAGSDCVGTKSMSNVGGVCGTSNAVTGGTATAVF